MQALAKLVSELQEAKIGGEAGSEFVTALKYSTPDRGSQVRSRLHMRVVVSREHCIALTPKRII